MRRNSNYALRVFESLPEALKAKDAIIAGMKNGKIRRGAVYLYQDREKIIVSRDHKIKSQVMCRFYPEKYFKYNKGVVTHEQKTIHI